MWRERAGQINLSLYKAEGIYTGDEPPISTKMIHKYIDSSTVWLIVLLWSESRGEHRDSRR